MGKQEAVLFRVCPFCLPSCPLITLCHPLTFPPWLCQHSVQTTFHAKDYCGLFQSLASLPAHISALVFGLHKGESKNEVLVTESIVQHNYKVTLKTQVLFLGPKVPCSLVSRLHHEEDDLVNQVEFF